MGNMWWKEQVYIWRRSYDVNPPGGESLKEVVARVKPYYDKFVEPKIGWYPAHPLIKINKINKKIGLAIFFIFLLWSLLIYF